MPAQTPNPDQPDGALEASSAAPPDSSKRPKATQAEAQQRTAQVLQWIIAGAPRFEIVRLSAEKWAINERQAQNYIARARELLRESSRLTVEQWVDQGIAQRQQLYALAMESGDLRTALTVLADLGKLTRAYPPSRLRATPGENESHPPLSSECSSGADAGDAALINTAEVVKVLGRRLRQVDESDLDPEAKARLTASLSDSLLRAIGVDVLQKRLEALEAVLIGRKDKER